VPSEMRGLLAEQVLPRLAQRDGADRPQVVLSRTLRTTGVAESSLAERIGRLDEEVAPLTLAYLPSPHGVDLRLTAWGPEQGEAEARLAAAMRRLRAILGEACSGEAAPPLA